MARLSQSVEGCMCTLLKQLMRIGRNSHESVKPRTPKGRVCWTKTSPFPNSLWEGESWLPDHSPRSAFLCARAHPRSPTSPVLWLCSEFLFVTWMGARNPLPGGQSGAEVNWVSSTLISKIAGDSSYLNLWSRMRKHLKYIPGTVTGNVTLKIILIHCNDSK